jgi:hypothetical protein
MNFGGFRSYSLDFGEIQSERLDCISKRNAELSLAACICMQHAMLKQIDELCLEISVQSNWPQFAEAASERRTEGIDIQSAIEKWSLMCKIHSKRSEEDPGTIVMKAYESNHQKNICSSLPFESRAGSEDSQNSTILFGMNQWKRNISVIYSRLAM